MRPGEVTTDNQAFRQILKGKRKSLLNNSVEIGLYEIGI